MPGRPSAREVSQRSNGQTYWSQHTYHTNPLLYWYVEERWSPSHYQVNKLFDHGYVQLIGHADAVLETGRNIPEKLRNAIERRLEKIAESEMDLDYLGRQIVARFQYESVVSRAREYDDEEAVIAYARKVLLGLDQHDDRSESPQIEADMGPPPIGKAQAIRLIKRNPKSNALKRDRQGKKFGYFIERPPIHGWQPGNVACLQVPCQRTPKKTGRWLACHPQPIACSRSALTRSRSSSQVTGCAPARCV
jgi:hypothetical protein